MNKEHNCQVHWKLYVLLKKAHYNTMKQNRLLDTANCLEQVPPEMENNKFSACFISGDSFTINTLLFQKYIKDSQI